jgi:hypothetical protein
MAWKESLEFMKKIDKIRKQRRSSLVFFTGDTCVSEKNRTSLHLHNHFCKLNQNKSLSLMFLPCGQPMQVKRI